MQKIDLEKWKMKNEGQKENELLDKMPGWIKIIMDAIQKMPGNKKEVK
jgi:hypothetical protein